MVSVRRRSALSSLLLVIALVAAACGGTSSSDTEVSSVPTSQADEVPQTTSTDAAAPETTATSPSTEPAVEATDITLVVPNSACFTYLPLYVAVHRGFYEDLGLNVDVRPVDGTTAAIQALAAGNAEFGIPSPVAVLTSIERGVNMTTFFNVKPGGSFGLIVQTDSGIETAADLEGQVVGISTSDGSEVPFARAVMDTAGLVEGEDYEMLVVGDGGPAVAGFTRGDIQAYSSSYADTAVITQAGLDVFDITPAEVRAFFFGNGLTALTETVEEHPEWAEALALGFAQASAHAWENPEDTLDVCAEVNPPEVEDRDFARALLNEMWTPHAPIGDDTLGYFNPASWEMVMEQAIEGGSLEGPVDLEIAFTNSFVEPIDPAITEAFKAAQP